MANFTTADKVRDEAGFAGNSNITDTQINEMISQANGQVFSYVASRYDGKNLNSSNSDFNGSKAEQLLVRAETLLAAGYLLIREYPDAPNEMTDGYRRLSEWESLLNMIMTGKTLLLDNNFNEFALADLNSNPNGKLTVTGAKKGENKFSVDDKF